MLKRTRKVVSKSGFKGVTFRKDRKLKPFEAWFTVPVSDKRLKIHVGTYKTAEDANRARLDYIDSLKG